MMRAINTMIVIAMLLAALGQFLAITSKANIYDSMPTRCGYKLKDVCPPSGFNWGHR